MDTSHLFKMSSWRWVGDLNLLLSWHRLRTRVNLVLPTNKSPQMLEGGMIFHVNYALHLAESLTTKARILDWGLNDLKTITQQFICFVSANTEWQCGPMQKALSINWWSDWTAHYQGSGFSVTRGKMEKNVDFSPLLKKTVDFSF